MNDGSLSCQVVVFAGPVVDLLQRNALVDNLETVARREIKTHLLSSAARHAAAEPRLGRHPNAGHTVSLILIDVDRFKSVNHTYGYIVGDLVLLTSTLYSHDLVGRFVGPEFVTPIPGFDPAEALTAAERVRTAIAARSHQVPQPADSAAGPRAITTAAPAGGPLLCRAPPRSDRPVAPAVTPR